MGKGRELHRKTNEGEARSRKPIYFDHYDPEALANILEIEIMNSLKQRGNEKLFQVLVIIDDFNANHPIIRVNFTELYAHRPRNTKDLHTVVEEVSAAYDKKTLLASTMPLPLRRSRSAFFT